MEARPKSPDSAQIAPSSPEPLGSGQLVAPPASKVESVAGDHFSETNVQSFVEACNAMKGKASSSFNLWVKLSKSERSCPKVVSAFPVFLRQMVPCLTIYLLEC